jgi:methionyl-tRNA formyltransferase
VSDAPRAIVLTSTFLRHQFVVNRCAERLVVAGVWQEEKSFRPERYAASPDDEAVIAAHFAERNRSEEKFFGGDSETGLAADARTRRIQPGQINDPAEVDLMVELKPDVVLVFGTGLLREPLLGRFAGRIINLHLGLSPYYRGAGTNFWPLVNREPEYVGATIHYLDAGIDTGPIIAHARPQIDAADGPHEIGNKTIVAAARVLAGAARAHVAGTISAMAQPAGGRLYQRKDFCADAVRRLRANFATGMIPEYLAARTERDGRLSLRSLDGAA